MTPGLPEASALWREALLTQTQSGLFQFKGMDCRASSPGKLGEPRRSACLGAPSPVPRHIYEKYTCPSAAPGSSDPRDMGCKSSEEQSGGCGSGPHPSLETQEDGSDTGQRTTG